MTEVTFPPGTAASLPVSCIIEFGDTSKASIMKAEHAIFLDVASMRADPRDPKEPSSELGLMYGVWLVPKMTVSPGAIVNEVAAASFAGVPPKAPNNSTPTCMGAVSVDVHENITAVPPGSMMPSTE
jgi:hypothetical protein